MQTKPHIFFQAGRWICVHRGQAWGAGTTQLEAYWNMRRYHTHTLGGLRG